MNGALLLTFLLAATGSVRDLGDPEVVLSVPWGSGGTMLTRVDGNESSSEGPMSFAVAKTGDIYVLDQAASRVVRYGTDGQYIRELPLPGSTFQDIDVFRDGRLVVLDRLVRETILVIGESTGETRELPFLGEGIEEGGGVTALLARDDGVWLEYAHTTSVRVLDEGLVPCARTIVKGRPATERGKRQSLVAALDRATGSADVVVTGPDGDRRIRVTHDEPFSRIAWMEDDRAGNLVFAFHVMRFDDSGLKLLYEYDGGQVFSPDGTLRATFRSPYVIQEWEQLRELYVTEDGGIYQMAFTPDGVKVLRWNLPPATR